MTSGSKRTRGAFAHVVRTLSHLAGWAGALGGLLSLVLRYIPPLHPTSLLLAALAPFALIAVAVAFGIGIIFRGQMLRWFSAAVLLVGTLIIWPFDALVDCRRPEAGQPDTLVIYQANVLRGNNGGLPERFREDIIAADPDVLLLQEASPSFLATLDDGTLRQFTFRVSDQDTTLWSRLPATSEPTLDWRSGPPMVSADFDALGTIVQISSVHMRAPTSSRTVETWERQFDEVGDIVGGDRPTIIGGDFNATDAHRPFRELTSQALRDVHDEAGCGMDATWPVQRLDPLPVPPLLRLDHVLVSPDFDVVGLRVGPLGGEPLGSDHHPVVVTLRRSVP